MHRPGFLAKGTEVSALKACPMHSCWPQSWNCFSVIGSFSGALENLLSGEGRDKWYPGTAINQPLMELVHEFSSLQDTSLDCDFYITLQS